MHRYHFDLLDTINVTDVTGALLADDESARKVGLELVREARAGRPDLMGRGYEILVRRDSGEEITRLAIDLPPKPANGD